MSLNYPHIKTKLPGPQAQTIIAQDHAVMSPSYTRPYPLVIARGEGCMVEDVDGNRFLDLCAGIAVTATGHCHPEVVKAIQSQSEQFLHICGADFYYAVQSDLAQRLAIKRPGPGDSRVFFCNSGTEAVEAAIKLARYHTKRSHIIGFLNAFHGRTYGSLSITNSKPVQREGFAPFVPEIHHVPFPNPDQQPENMSPEEYGIHCVQQIRELLLAKNPSPDQVAAIIVEPIQGEGGIVVPPAIFFKELQTLCREFGILLILDEIQSGMGRTGKFFACEHFDVRPDMITMAKGIASGLPLGVLISRSDIMDWPPGAHASTFGGNPVACTAALKTLDLVEAGLMDNAAQQGDYFKQKLQALQEQFTWISDVRGKGLMLAIEIDGSEDEAVVRRNEIVQRCFEKGLLLLGCGTQSIRFTPALMITREEIDVALKILEDVFAQ